MASKRPAAVDCAGCAEAGIVGPDAAHSPEECQRDVLTHLQHKFDGIEELKVTE